MGCIILLTFLSNSGSSGKFFSKKSFVNNWYRTLSNVELVNQQWYPILVATKRGFH